MSSRNRLDPIDATEHYKRSFEAAKQAAARGIDDHIERLQKTRVVVEASSFGDSYIVQGRWILVTAKAGYASIEIDAYDLRAADLSASG